MMKHKTLILIVLSICPFLAGSQQYNIIRQGVCWTTPTAVDSSLTRLVYVSVSGAGPISVNYINSYGTAVDVSGGGSFEMGYCGCCAPPVDSTAIDSLFYQGGESILNGDTIPLDSAYTPGVIPVSSGAGTRAYITQLPAKMNYNHFYGRPELGTYPAEGASQYTGLLQWYDSGANFQENFFGPGEIYVNNWVSGSARFLQGVELFASGAGGGAYNRNAAAGIAVYSAVPNNFLLSQIRFKNQYAASAASQITPFTISHVSTTGTSTTGGRLYFSRSASPSTYASVTNAANIFFWIDNATRSFGLNNTYNGSSRNDYATFPPSRPLYTDASGNVLQAPLDSFSVFNLFTGGPTTLNALHDSLYNCCSGNVANADLVADGSHVTDWLTHSLTFDYTGAELDTIVFRWPSPDGEVQGLYISDGAQEMALLMNDVRGTDFAGIINYNLSDEIVFGNTGDTTVTQADKWFADVANMVRGDTVKSVMVIDSDKEIKLKYVPISGRVSDTTDGSGDIVIPLGVTMSSVNFTALVGARGTLFQQAQVIANTATQITVRVLDDSGAPITGSAVVVDWMVMDY